MCKYNYKCSSIRRQIQSTAVTGIWWWTSRWIIIEQTFSIGEKSEERASQSTNETFFLSKKVRTIPEICGRTLFCWNVKFHRIRKYYKTRSYHNKNVAAIVHSAVSGNKNSPRCVPSAIPYHYSRLMGKYSEVECTLSTCVLHEINKHECDHHDVVNRIEIRLKPYHATPE